MSIINDLDKQIFIDKDNNRCYARLQKDLKSRCSNKIHISNNLFCGKHIKNKDIIRFDEPIVKEIKNSTKNKLKIINLIDINGTKKLSENNIIHTLKYYNQDYFNKNKCKNINILQEFLRKNNIYIENIDKIIKIQKLFKRYLLKRNIILRGPGFINRKLLNNETDFLTFEKCKDIPESEFFSYRDIDGFIYGFNIKSINYLKDTNPKNPYTRRELSRECVDNLNKLMRYNNNNLKIDRYKPIDNYTKMKHRCVKIFQRMDELELYVQPRWFLDLNIINLKNLYAFVEDIWNYRAMLTNENKLNYTKNGKAFLHNIFVINNIVEKIYLQNLLLDEFEKFAFQGKTNEDCITSCYWILTGLTMVSDDAAEGCPELVQSHYIVN